MAGWQNLPTETIILIVSFLDQPSLASTSLVSRFLHATSELHLYGSLVLGSSEQTDMSHQRTDAAKKCKAMRRLIRTFVRKPELASRVRSLKIGEWKYSGGFFPSYRTQGLTSLNSAAPDAELAERLLNSKTHEECADIAVIIKAASDVGMSIGWIYFQSDSFWGFWGLLILILHHLPRIDTLSLMELGSATIVSELARGQVSGGVPKCIPGIVKLDILPPLQGSDSPRDDRDHVLAELALLLPKLSSVCVSSVCITSPDRSPTRGSSAESIRHIEFSRCCRPNPMTMGQLGGFLRIFTGLKSFAFTEEDVEGPPDDTLGHIDCHELGKAIAAHASSLSMLDVTCGIRADGLVAPIIFAHSIGSLHDYRALQHIRIRVDILIGREVFSSSTKSRLSDKLPSSLTTLCLVLPDQWGVAWFVEVTGLPWDWEQERLHFSALEYFTIQHLPTVRGERKFYETLDAETLAAFASAKIKLLPPMAAKLVVAMETFEDHDSDFQGSVDEWDFDSDE